MYNIFCLLILFFLHLYDKKLKFTKEQILNEIKNLEEDIIQYKESIENNVRAIEGIKHINSLEFCEEELIQLKEALNKLQNGLKDLRNKGK